MSKLLKFIVHFVVICTVLCVAALVVPPFFGVEMAVMDDPDKTTNLPLGSVTYAIPVNTNEVTLGTPILVQKDAKTYRYNIVTLDLENHTGTVIDSTADAPQAMAVAVKNKVPKVVITLPFLGYLLVATESIEGLIVLGLAVLFLIILYVIAELWKKEPKEWKDEEEETLYLKSSKELKREERARAKRIQQEDREFLKEEKKRRKKEKKIIKTGGFVDEIYEEEEETDDSDMVQNATSEAHELLKKEIAAATAEGPLFSSMTIHADDIKEATELLEEYDEEELEEPEVIPEIKKLAIPRMSAAQLAERAKRSGDAPEIVKDSITNVTLFDYSDIIADDIKTEK